MLTRKQFDLLVYKATHNCLESQKDISKKMGISIGTIRKLRSELIDKGLLSNGMITDAGFEALEPYRVKRAIILAAGFGSRLVPITLNTPKPLIRIKGERIIDSLLDALLSAEIEEIYVVRGYLGEQFDQLLYKYPMIKFIENPAFNEANNIVSMIQAGDLVKNAYIFEGDLLLKNPKLIQKYQYNTNYLGIPVERTDDWCFFYK